MPILRCKDQVIEISQETLNTHLIIALSSKYGNLLSFLTRWFSHSFFSHVVLVNPDLSNLVESTDNGGVRTASLDYLDSRDNVVFKKIPHRDPQRVWELCLTQLGKPYDNTYSFGYLFHRDWQDPSAWACTELIGWAAGAAGEPIFPEGVNILTPRDFNIASKLL